MPLPSRSYLDTRGYKPATVHHLELEHDMNAPSAQDLRERLKNAVPTVTQISTLCGTPSTSFGVLHQGHVILSESVGYRDGDPANPADEHSVYLLGSLSKSFVAAAVGILVDEGKMSWTDTVAKHVPGFRPVGDPRIGEEADFIDLLRHSSGLGNPVVQIIGPHGAIIAREDKLMDLINEAHTLDDQGQQRFNQSFEYSNINYVLAAIAVENLSGMRYADFVKTKILEPLSMRETMVNQHDLAAYRNLADGHALMEDGVWVKVPVEWTSETHTSVLAPYGVRSSVHDLLIWAAAWMSAEEEGDALPGPHALLNASFNPLRQVQRILKPAWELPPEAPDEMPPTYCLGWVRAVMPTAAVNWGASNGRTEDDNTHLRYILGTSSPTKIMYKHTGMAYNTTSALFLFPETHSAVVALSNGRRRGDASDFAAQVLIQELFDMQPHVDIASRAKIETERGAAFRHNTVMEPWLKNRDVTRVQQPEAFIGDFASAATELHVQMDSSRRLFLHFNDRSDKPLQLEYYNKDQYSFFPTTTDRHFSGGFMDYDHYTVGMLDFKRDETGVVNGLYWTWEIESPPTWYERKSPRLTTKAED